MAHSFLPLSWLLVTKVGLTRAEKMPEPKPELKSRAQSLGLKTEARKARRLIEHLAITEEPDTSSSEPSSPNGQPPSAHGQAPSADWQAPSSSAQPKQLPDERKGKRKSTEQRREQRKKRKRQQNDVSKASPHDPEVQINAKATTPRYPIRI